MFGLHILVWRARFCLGQPQSFTTRYYGLGANTLPSIHFPQHRFSTSLSCTQRSRNNLYSSQFHRPRPTTFSFYKAATFRPISLLGSRALLHHDVSLSTRPTGYAKGVPQIMRASPTPQGVPSQVNQISERLRSYAPAPSPQDDREPESLSQRWQR
jgi:hypothetical protein